jgi:hypothetical protein
VVASSGVEPEPRSDATDYVAAVMGPNDQPG